MTHAFVAGGVTGLAPEAGEHLFAPRDWLLQHPATRRWMAKMERQSLGAAEVIDTAIDLDGGFEGIVLSMTITGKAGLQGNNSGIGWRIYVNRSPWLQTNWPATTGTSDGRFDMLVEADGLGDSWDANFNLWLPDNALLEVGMNNNGGTSDPMGWIMWGAYWPTTLRGEYDTYRRAMQRRVAK
jgi:hypothetical protein